MERNDMERNDDDIDVALENLLKPKKCIRINVAGSVTSTTVRVCPRCGVESEYQYQYLWQYLRLRCLTTPHAHETRILL